MKRNHTADSVSTTCNTLIVGTHVPFSLEAVSIDTHDDVKTITESCTIDRIGLCIRGRKCTLGVLRTNAYTTCTPVLAYLSTSAYPVMVLIEWCWLRLADKHSDSIAVQFMFTIFETYVRRDNESLKNMSLWNSTLIICHVWYILNNFLWDKQTKNMSENTDDDIWYVETVVCHIYPTIHATWHTSYIFCFTHTLHTHVPSTDIARPTVGRGRDAETHEWVVSTKTSFELRKHLIIDLTLQYMCRLNKKNPVYAQIHRKIMCIFLPPIYLDDTWSNRYNLSRKAFGILQNELSCHVFYSSDNNARW